MDTGTHTRNVKTVKKRPFDFDGGGGGGGKITLVLEFFSHTGALVFIFCVVRPWIFFQPGSCV